MAERFLEGRAAIVTGGATGQGRATALALAAAGADVAIGGYLADGETDSDQIDTTHPSRDELDRAIAEIAGHGVRAVGCDHDLGSDKSCQELVDLATQTFGKVDILMNVAGISIVEPVAGHDDALWHRVIDVNLSGPYRMIKRCLPGMIERSWGRIVNIASTAANVGAEGAAAYCSSKSGLLGLTRCVALEGAAHGVTCNAINPGYVRTDMMMADLLRRARTAGDNRSIEEQVAEIEASYPQKRIIEPEEIGALAVFFCRDEARGLTMEDVTLACGSLW
jgi:NAD(P)-dependent dehydrogenase (short-subunit alcohol dehydrogenase family)